MRIGQQDKNRTALEHIGEFRRVFLSLGLFFFGANLGRISGNRFQIVKNNSLVHLSDFSCNRWAGRGYFVYSYIVLVMVIFGQ